jgi:hypothetical protein
MLSDCEDFTDMGHFVQSQIEWIRAAHPQPLVSGEPMPSSAGRDLSWGPLPNAR